MFALVTSLRHPKDAVIYQRALSFFETSARSICQQTYQDFILVVVCNEKPNIEFTDPRIHYHVVDFAAPLPLDAYLEQFNISHENISCYPKKQFPNRGDKGSKILSGLLYAKQFAPEYAYILDSDDWVHCELLTFVAAQPKQPLWYVNQSYYVNFAQKTYMKRYGTVRHCGSTLIYAWDYLFSLGDVQPSLDHKSSQKELLSGSSIKFVHDICGNHTEQYNLTLKQGIKPTKIPFPAICYVLATGENEVQDVNLQNGFPINEKVIKEFGLNRDYISSETSNWLTMLKQLSATAKSKIGWYVAKFRLHSKYKSSA